MKWQKKCFFGLLFFVFSVVAYAESTPDPRYPEREYRRFVLENGLQVFLISDSSITHAAASLSVEVGSLSDPKEQQGMAHFLEHMLFLGTKKYPDVGSYKQFINTHDGYSNAYTAGDHTNYHFEIAADHLEPALDRFSQFFVAPLFTPDYVEREQNAVHSEHSKNLSSDFWRMRQVQRSHYDKTHPANRFSTGNLETLKSIKQSELKKFYQKYYSANLMNLVVLGKQSLDELEQWARQKFDAVQNTGATEPRFPQRLFKQSDRLRVLRIKSIKDTRTLSLSFNVPSTEPFYASRPLGLIAFLVGHEGEGSLLSLLKKENLASALSAGEGEGTNSFGSFRISIELTPKGLKNYQKVIQRVFQYFALLRQKGLPEYIFAEEKQMSRINYRFDEKSEGANYVSGLAALLHSVPLKWIEKSSLLFTHYQPEVFDRFLFQLTPKNVWVTLLSQQEPTSNVEPYYGTEYSLEVGDGRFVKQLERLELEPELQLPKPNPFIPEELVLQQKSTTFTLNHESLTGLRYAGASAELLKWIQSHPTQTWPSIDVLLEQLPESLKAEKAFLSKNLKPHQFVPPQNIVKTEFANIWFQPDLRFQTPKATLILMLHSNQVYQTPKHAVLAQLFQDALNESLNEFRYPVTMAGLSFGFSVNKQGLTLTLSGYSDQILALFQTILPALQNLDISEEVFSVIKEKRKRAYQNFAFHKPYEQSLYINQLFLEEKKFSMDAYLAEIDAISLKELMTYSKQVFEQMFIEGIAHGNLNPAEVQTAVVQVFKQLKAKPLPKSEQFEEHILMLPHSKKWVYQKSLKVDNSALLWHTQVGPSDPKLRGALLVLRNALQPHFYTELRTKQQLGYIVHAGLYEMEKVLGMIFLVQSGSHPPEELYKRIEAYMPQFLALIESMPQEQFEALKQASVTAKLEKPQSIGEQAQRLYAILTKKDEQFEHVSEDILAVEQLTLEYVQQVAQQYLTPEAQKAVIYQLRASNLPEQSPSESVLTSVEAFRKTLNPQQEESP